MLCYLAGPIDQAHGDSELGRLRAEAMAHLNEEGFAVFDPSKAFSVPTDMEANGSIQRVNFAAIDRADAVLALLPSGVPTTGTPMEVMYAHGVHKPVSVITDMNSWALQGLDDVYVVAEQFIDMAVKVLKTKVAERITSDPGVKVQLLEDHAVLPTKAYPGDAGWDLYASAEVEIGPGDFKDVPVGIAIALPEGWFARITSRSSTFRNLRLDVREGVIDAGYRGPIFAGVHNEGDEPQTVRVGDRVAQMLIHDVPSLPLVVTEQLPSSKRGTNGFGSSGK